MDKHKYAVVRVARDKKRPQKKATITVIAGAESAKAARVAQRRYVAKHPKALSDVGITRWPILNIYRKPLKK